MKTKVASSLFEGLDNLEKFQINENKEQIEKTTEKTVHKPSAKPVAKKSTKAADEKSIDRKEVNEEKKIKTSIRLYAEANLFVKIRSSQLRISQSSYLELLLSEEKQRIEQGKEPDPFEIQGKIPPKHNGVMKFCEWNESIYLFMDEESHYLGLKKAEYMNYIVNEEIKREKNEGVRR